VSQPAHEHEWTPSGLNLRFFDFENNVVRSYDETSSNTDPAPWGERPVPTSLEISD